MALNIALIQPQIPPNTGNIARLCVATDTPLHLIEPLGFSITDAEVRRAGLDYWDRLDLWVHPNWFAFRDAINRSRCLCPMCRDRVARRDGSPYPACPWSNSTTSRTR